MYVKGANLGFGLKEGPYDICPGAKKKNLYTPSRSVFVDWIVPFALSRITTSASGRRAFV